MLEQPLLFTGCSSIQFINLIFVTYGTPCRARGHHSHLEQPLLFTGCSSIQFFNSSFFVTSGTPCRASGHHSHLIFCDLRDTMPHQRSLLSPITTFVTYGTLCHDRSYHSHFPPNLYLEVATSKNSFSTLLPKEIHFRKLHFQNL